MSGRTQLLILSAVFVALLAFVYFYEIRGKEERENREEERSKLVQIKADKVIRVSLLRRNESPITLEKRDGQWKISQPVQAKADSTAVEGLLQALADATSSRTIEKPVLEKYGLKDPVVTLNLEEGGKKYTIRFGDKDFSGSNVYVAKEGDPNVYLVSDSPHTKATQSITDFRDKNILELDADTVRQIEIKRQGDTVMLNKEKDGWYVTQPLAGPADQATVDGLVDAIRYGRIQTFAEESLNNLKHYGLEPPTIRLVLTSGDKKAELNVGSKLGDNYYAYTPGRTVVFTVSKDIEEKAGQSADQFQSRDVVRFEREKVTKIEVQGEKGKWVAEKKGGQWKVIEPAGKDKKSFLDYRVFLALEDLKAEKVLRVGAVTLKSPVIVTRASGDTPFQVEIFKKDKEWFARSSQSDKIYKMNEVQVQALNEPLDHFLE